MVLVHDPLVSELLIKRELDLKPWRLGMGDGTVSNESDGYDPFAVFQAMADGPSSRELYGEFADLRAKASVHEGVHVGRREADGTTGDIPLDVTGVVVTTIFPLQEGTFRGYATAVRLYSSGDPGLANRRQRGSRFRSHTERPRIRAKRWIGDVDQVDGHRVRQSAGECRVDIKEVPNRDVLSHRRSAFGWCNAVDSGVVWGEVIRPAAHQADDAVL